MLDQYNRNINYMRISLTDRCNLRCIYCRPDIAQLVDHSQILRYEEILRVAKCAVSLGITRFKITGGEPLVRKGAVDFITRLKSLPGVEQVTLTTNGTFLEQYLQQFLDAKIDGINISLDTLNREFYKQITGIDNIESVLEAVKEAIAAGIKCKLNCVPLKANCGVFSERLNHNQSINLIKDAMVEKMLLELCQYAEQLKLPLRFIELMPLTCNEKLFSYSGTEIRRILVNNGYGLEPMQAQLGNGPAVYYEARRGLHSQILGFIEPLHNKFCASCNRLRLTSTGQLKSCLYSEGSLDLRQLLRSGVDDAKISEALQEAIYAKPIGHHFEEKPATFNMNEIGG